MFLRIIAGLAITAGLIAPACAETACMPAAAFDNAVAAGQAPAALPAGQAARFRLLFNASPPITAYAGPVYMRDLPDRGITLIALVVDDRVCVIRMDGEQRKLVLRVINGG